MSDELLENTARALVIFEEDIAAARDESARDATILNLCTYLEEAFLAASSLPPSGQEAFFFALERSITDGALALVGWDLVKHLSRYVAIGEDPVRLLAHRLMQRCAQHASPVELIVVLCERLERWKWRKDPRGLLLQVISELTATCISRLETTEPLKYVSLIVGSARAPLDELAQSISVSLEDKEDDISESVARPANVEAAAVAFGVITAAMATVLGTERRKPMPLEEPLDDDQMINAAIARIILRIFGSIIINSQDMACTQKV